MFLLVGITFGLASVYVTPYVEATLSYFYKDIKVHDDITNENNDYLRQFK